MGMVNEKADIDAKDLRILHELEVDGRASLVKLSKTAGISREAAGHRLGRLKENSAIQCFATKVDLNRLGLTNYGIFFRLANTNKKTADRITKYLAGHPDTLWVATLGGRFDLAVEIAARNTRHFNAIYNGMLDKYGKYLGHGDIAIRLYQTGFTRGFLHEKKDERQCPTLDEVPQVALDAESKKIMNLLVMEPRMPLNELGRKAGMPASTAAYRLKQLQNDHVIRGFTILPDAEVIGYRTYKLLLALREFSFKTWERVFEFCCTHPNVSYVVKSIGKWEIEIEVETEDQKRYQEFIMQVRNVFGDVIQDLESVEIFHTHKYVCCPRLE